MKDFKFAAALFLLATGFSSYAQTQIKKAIDLSTFVGTYQLARIENATRLMPKCPTAIRVALDGDTLLILNHSLECSDCEAKNSLLYSAIEKFAEVDEGIQTYRSRSSQESTWTTPTAVQKMVITPYASSIDSSLQDRYESSLVRLGPTSVSFNRVQTLNNQVTFKGTQSCIYQLSQ